jgi:hypothetical protein
MTSDPEVEGESAIERSYSTRHSTRDSKRKSRAKPLLADADWDNSRHDRIPHEEDEDDYEHGKRNAQGKARFDAKAKDANGVELVTVPALGPEYVPLMTVALLAILTRHFLMFQMAER